MLTTVASCIRRNIPARSSQSAPLANHPLRAFENPSGKTENKSQRARGDSWFFSKTPTAPGVGLFGGRLFGGFHSWSGPRGVRVVFFLAGPVAGTESFWLAPQQFRGQPQEGDLILPRGGDRLGGF